MVTFMINQHKLLPSLEESSRSDSGNLIAVATFDSLMSSSDDEWNELVPRLKNITVCNNYVT